MYINVRFGKGKFKQWYFLSINVLCRSMGPCRTFVCREKLRSLCWKPELGLFGLFSTIRCPTRPCRSATGFPIASPNRSFTPTLSPTCVFLIPELCAFSIFYILIPHSATTLRCQHISPNLCLRGWVQSATYFVLWVYCILCWIIVNKCKYT